MRGSRALFQRFLSSAIVLAALYSNGVQGASGTELDEQIDHATRALEAGNLPEAEKLLLWLGQVAPRHRQVRFLQAHLALRKGQHGPAIDLLRDLLSEDPSLVRVRLDLARALYEAGHHEAAQHHFELALGAGLPPVVQRNVEMYLDAIRHLDTYLTIRAFVLRDSNANQGPRSGTIYLFGLPFTLAPEARPRRASGVVLTADGRMALGRGRGTYVLMNLEERRYDDRSVDYRFVQAGAGQSVYLGGWRLGAELGYYDSRFQHQSLSEGPWVRAYAWTQLGPRAQLSPAFQRRRNRYATHHPLTSTLDTASLDASVALAPRLSVAAGLTAARNAASNPLHGFHSREFRLAGLTELPYGFIIDVGAAYAASRYDAHDFLFGVRRSDRQTRLEINVTQRHWRLARVAPKIFISHVRNRSNVPLHDWNRQVAGVGMTGRF
jgi:outer membrane protein